MKRNGESGFALLLVFAMASIIAISLYYAMPRVTFEAERDKEQLLIDRGEQYTRAIQLYVRKTKRFPGKIEDLENTNGIRFLRRQYVDPMTGKSEWRIIHAGPGGMLLDSLLKKQEKKDAKVVDNFITDLGSLGGTLPADGSVNPALRHRPSDQAGAPGGTTANAGPIPPDPLGTGASSTPAASVLPGATAANTNLPGQFPGQGTASGGTAANTAPTSGISVLPSFGSAPTQPSAGQQLPRAQFPGTQFPGAQLPGAVAQQINNPGQGLPGGFVPSGGANQTDASRMIQGLLTSPRPGGLSGLQGAQQGGGQQIIGGGIAGVASTFKGTGIKTYNEQDEFPKWEFVYDLSKDKTMNPAANLPPATPAPGTPLGGQQQATPAGQAGTTSGTPGFGTAAPTLGVPLQDLK